ncbi:MAG: N-acetyl-gamma-glutamyl-phosphate reductase, partial [Eubacteriales bacterium]
MVNVGVIGATGYAGEELIRLLSAHPDVHICKLVSKSFSGQTMGNVYKNYMGEINYPLADLNTGELGSLCDFVFTSLPHGESMRVVPGLLQAGARVIDLSADFRYTDTSIFQEWYGIPQTATDAQAQAVYGLTEVNRASIKNAALIANPGCYTTCSILALMPVLKNKLIKASGIVIDAKSGVTGAGRKGDTAYSFCELEGNFKAYSAIRHRHTSEIEEQLSIASGEKITLLFTPHLLPVKRGILATIYTELAPGTRAGDITDAFQAAYADEPFVHVLPKGELPELKSVVGSNNLIIGFDISERTGRLVIVACLDNLIKGAAGQAIQNFNIMNGLHEKTALPRVAWY